MDESKIAFIMCINNDLFFEECVKYIQRLEVPEGMEVELVEIREASSMASGYNEGMNSTSAKYKVYMHQDVFILNRYFIFDIISIFRQDANIGMIGLVGTQDMPESAIMWLGDRVPEEYGVEKDEEEYRNDRENGGLWEVEAIDGLLMVTQYDIPWREDLFDGWDFYDISQSFEMRKRGYRLVVPVHHFFWHQHDDKPILSLWNYDRYRKRFIEEYDI